MSVTEPEDATQQPAPTRDVLTGQPAHVSGGGLGGRGLGTRGFARQTRPGDGRDSSPVATPANVLLARASHAAELAQGEGWSPHPQRQ